MEFGDLLRRILSLNDIKMYNLAAALGYDKSYISKWTNHAKLPPWSGSAAATGSG